MGNWTPANGLLLSLPIASWLPHSPVGSAPFMQDTSRTPTTTGGAPVNGASAHVSDLYELTTGDSRFQYAFKQYGTYQVIMKDAPHPFFLFSP